MCKQFHLEGNTLNILLLLSTFEYDKKFKYSNGLFLAFKGQDTQLEIQMRLKIIFDVFTESTIHIAKQTLKQKDHWDNKVNILKVQ